MLNWMDTGKKLSPSELIQFVKLLLFENQLRLTKLQRKSDSAGQEMHTTLNEIIKKIKEILKNIKKERDQFLAIKQTYNRNDFNIRI